MAFRDGVLSSKAEMPMKVLAFSFASLACLFGQQTGTDAPYRCTQVTQTVRLLQTLKALPDQDMRAAGSACDHYLTLLRGRQPQAAQEALANANTIMDRLGLTEMPIFARFEQ